TETNNGAGSVRWMAPETLNPSACGLQSFARTPASDIYAFGCVCLEVSRSPRPEGDVIPDNIWGIMQKCWAHNFAERP
ncbi:hypothetical protein C8R44DRAFT_553241, partial [Mycena epipterygia]